MVSNVLLLLYSLRVTSNRKAVRSPFTTNNLLVDLSYSSTHGFTRRLVIIKTKFLTNLHIRYYITNLDHARGHCVLERMKGKFKHWWSSIPPITTTWTITSHLNWTYWTQNDHVIWRWKSRPRLGTNTNMWRD
jgi:hypothetical protein